jgi:hypothetical protein
VIRTSAATADAARSRLPQSHTPPSTKMSKRQSSMALSVTSCAALCSPAFSESEDFRYPTAATTLPAIFNPELASELKRFAIDCNLQSATSALGCSRSTVRDFITATNFQPATAGTGPSDRAGTAKDIQEPCPDATFGEDLASSHPAPAQRRRAILPRSNQATSPGITDQEERPITAWI